MMAINPILFNGAMVRAILDGRKTVTRRVVKPQPFSKLAYAIGGSGHVAGTWGYPGKDAWRYWGDESFRLPEQISEKDLNRRWHPPCHTDDILYVKETWAPMYPNETSKEVCAYLYKADRVKYGEEYKKEYDLQYPNGKDYTWEGLWRPSIHMPREAARIWLRVTDVRVERLQDITPAQAEQEGVGNLFCEDIAYDNKDYGNPVDEEHGIAKEQFAWLWDSTIKKSDLDRYGWDANPWVWVIKFERCEKPGEG